MITLKQINYALAVADTLHFKRAADKCFVSPSTLSNAITEMEIQLGIQIFERDNKKVILTELGSLVIDKAKVIKTEIDGINKISQLNAEPLSNKISLRKTRDKSIFKIFQRCISLLGFSYSWVSWILFIGCITKGSISSSFLLFFGCNNFSSCCCYGINVLFI